MSLSISELTVSRGGGPVLRDLTLDLASGESVALIGKNGAGKTTLLETAAGLITPSSGRILLDETNITGLRPDQIATSGLTLAPEGRRLFLNMSVKENLALGAHRQQWWLGGPPAAAFELVWELFPDLLAFRGRKVGALSGGQQQMVSIGRALMTEPKVLMLDEPTFGLSPQLTESMWGHLVALSSAGFTILLAEQNVDVALDVATAVAVLHDGHIVYRGVPDNLNQALMNEAMFGSLAAATP